MNTFKIYLFTLAWLNGGYFQIPKPLGSTLRMRKNILNEYLLNFDTLWNFMTVTTPTYSDKAGESIIISMNTFLCNQEAESY